MVTFPFDAQFMSCEKSDTLVWIYLVFEIGEKKFLAFSQQRHLGNINRALP
jgi:hypothetical protein